MQNIYINRLWHALDNTTFYDAHGTVLSDYDAGIHAMLQMFLNVKKQQGKVFFVGNGGSAAIASHMTADYMKNGGMHTYSMYDCAVMTCLSNDYAYEDVFAKQLARQAQEGDLLAAISSSGNSANIVNAVQTARQKKVNVVTFTGFLPENRIKQMGDLNVHVPITEYGIVESIHNLILQQIVDCMIENS